MKSEISKLPNVNDKSIVKSTNHIPSKISADTLFTFVNKLEYLCQYLNYGYIPARYCIEDIGYLKIRGYKKIAIPMKCFCDIKLHDIKQHLQCYGSYGIAFSKEWGMERKLQPLQYINPNSFLCEDFSIAFKDAIKKAKRGISHLANDYMLEQLLLYLIWQRKRFRLQSGGREKII